jgi:hypothetical protein
MKKAHRQIESITMRLTALSTMGGTVLGLGVNTIHNPLYYKITQMKIPPQFFGGLCTSDLGMELFPNESIELDL